MKIFGIGLSKTGTTSLAAALELLGYRTRDYPGVQHYAAGDLASIDAQVLAQHEALTDTPIPSFYRELDRQYPGSKFILTVRDMDGWLLSCRKQFTARHAEQQNDAHRRLFVDLYGTAVFDEALFRSGYRHFVDGVVAHFKDRPGDLLVLDVAAGQGWDELCAFLGRPVPELPFPKSNVTRIQWMDLNELVAIAKAAGQELLRAHLAAAAAAGERAAAGVVPAFVHKAVVSLRGGHDAVMSAATGAAQRVLTQRLSRLSPDIPIVSRRVHGVPPDERARWSHFWLVDPLDGEAGFGTAEGEFSVDLALIENGKPIAGVVHAPLSGTTGFAMSGKGAFVAFGDAAATRLSAGGAPALPAAAPDAPAPASTALALWRQVDAGMAHAPAGSPDDSMEWHSAAPHALARQIGRRLVVDDSGAELTYNKPDWRNPRLRVV